LDIIKYEILKMEFHWGANFIYINQADQKKMFFYYKISEKYIYK